jgi:hypothetical protein
MPNPSPDETPMTPDARRALADAIEKKATVAGGIVDTRLDEEEIRDVLAALRSAPAEPPAPFWVRCPQCQNPQRERIAGLWLCQACGHEWDDPPSAEPPTTPAGTLDKRTIETLKILAEDGLTIPMCRKCDPEDYNNPATGHDEQCPRVAAQNVLTSLREAAPRRSAPQGEPPLTTWMTTDDPVKRDTAYLRMYAEHVRNGTDLTWDIPNTRAATLSDIAKRLERAQEPTGEPPTCATVIVTAEYECGSKVVVVARSDSELFTVRRDVPAPPAPPEKGYRNKESCLAVWDDEGNRIL